MGEIRAVNNRITAFLILTTGLASCASPPTGKPIALPPPPSGFVWHTAQNGAGSFLRPDDWFVKEEVSNETSAVFITRERIEAGGRFTVGLTVNRLAQFSKHSSVKPSVYAQQYVQALRSHPEVLKGGVVKGNASDMHVARIRGTNNGVSTIVHHIAIGIDSKDAVFIILFEAPETEWEQSFASGKPMLNSFILGT